VFSCGAVARKDTLYMYYGAADVSTGVAKLSIRRLLKMLSPSCLE
jgi:predicted GH43/DUF377 family glycosyl hydrolase